MIKNIDYVNAWQNRVGETTAHLRYDDKLLPQKQLVSFFQKAIDNFDLSKKHIIDIGCGGGLFGEWALENYNCEYSGMDIAERSCDAASERLNRKNLKSTIYLMPNPVDGLELLRKDGFDVAVCLNVIQHIPDIDYFNIFFAYLNKSNIKNLILQYKHSDLTLFQQAAYKTTTEINLACYTNQDDIIHLLDNYKIISVRKSKENRFLTCEVKGS